MDQDTDIIIPDNIDINEVEFTIFDTETTGLDAVLGDKIIEIAGVRIKGNQRLSVFESLVNPGRPVSEGAFRVNRISQDMLKDAPVFGRILPDFMNFIKGSCLCSYNARFDLGFLKKEMEFLGEDFHKEIVVVDVLTMARRLLPGMERYGLIYVAEKLLHSSSQEHRAMADVELTIGVFHQLLDILKNKNIYNWQNFLSLFSIRSSFKDNLDMEKIAKLQEAIELGAGLKIKYLSRCDAVVSERQIIPQEITYEGKYSYLQGYCMLKKQLRTFRVDGILKITPV